MSKQKEQEVLITAPNFQTAVFTIRGTSPYVQEQFSQKVKNSLMDKKKEAGKKAKIREKWSPEDEAENLSYRFREGGYGIPVSHIKGAMVRACSLIGLPMTKAKMIVFVEGDGFDVVDNKPLIKFTKGGKYVIQTEGFSVGMSSGRNDVHARPLYKDGWEAEIRIRFDADILTTGMVANLLYRAGLMVGIGAWRPQRGGQWGTFEIVKNGKDK